MAKRLWAMWIKQLFLAFVVVFCAGALFNVFAAEVYARQPFTAGFWTLLIYVVAAFIMTSLNAISGGLYLWLFGGSDLTGAIVDEFRHVKLPGPRSDDPKNFDYLAALADDETAPASDRVKAALLYGSYKATMGNGIFRALTVRKALDDAVLRYAQEMPARAYGHTSL
jgi:hypothetical protein